MLQDIADSTPQRWLATEIEEWDTEPAFFCLHRGALRTVEETDGSIFLELTEQGKKILGLYDENGERVN